MSLESIWQAFQQSGSHDLPAPQSALEAFYLAILAFTADDFAEAARLARQAHDWQPDHLVYAAAYPYLERVAERGKGHVYDTAEGFKAYIRGGGNVPLYQNTSARLQEVYRQYDSLTVLDIGVGDGLALLPALVESITHLTVVEPSESMLALTRSALEARHVPHDAFHGTLQQAAQHFTRNWDVAQATYSLQSIPPDERIGLLRWVGEHAPRLLIAEFDVPTFAHMHAPDYVESILDRCQVGLSEYEGEDRRLVAEFIIPVMFGWFDRSAARTNYEHPLATWVEQLHAAGFSRVESRPIYDYWWSPAVLIDAWV